MGSSVAMDFLFKTGILFKTGSRNDILKISNQKKKKIKIYKKNETIVKIK